ncbi:UNVERIFIED_CONTAM: hypothetical protein FKN15_024734 [Acipenser sinensis]
MPLLPNLNSLGKLCGSPRSRGVMPDKPARRSSVKRMSVIEDGDLAEVLYLIPKQSMLRQLPNLNPNDYYLCERLMDVAIDPRLNQDQWHAAVTLNNWNCGAHALTQACLTAANHGQQECLQLKNTLSTGNSYPKITARTFLKAVLHCYSGIRRIVFRVWLLGLY